jgi:PadR family transcriptional regulator, regulatory protein PadR
MYGSIYIASRDRYVGFRGSDALNEQSPVIDVWNTQLRKGIAELCVLGAIAQLKLAYGYQLIQHLSHHEGMELTEGTVYPLLAKLTRLGHLSVQSQQSSSGPPRRYYSLTKSGFELLGKMHNQWTLISKSIERILMNPEENKSQ